MDQKHEITISVGNLVEFLLRSGDLDARFSGSGKALVGTRGHQRIQKSYNDGYIAEVALKHSIEFDDFVLTIRGRADGIIIEQEKVTVDEIKTVTKSLEILEEEENELHWAQTKCYAYIYGKQEEKKEVQVQLTYYRLDTEEIKKIQKTFKLKELEAFFLSLIHQYFAWASLIREWSIKRNDSIQKLQFPFETYRKGQRKLAVAVYKTIKEKKKIFVQAPTGIGKTISTLFPAVKAMGEGLTSKMFYLTAKTVTQRVAEEAFEKMKEKGLAFKTVTITAKDKICFEKDAKCTPEECSFAKGHYNRVNEAIGDIFPNENHITKEIIENYSKKYHICPFEFSLDLTIWVDCVICDYNYVFDPRVYLKRFFLENNGKYTFLIDEAHNLVDRSRNMFSAELYKKSFLDLKRMMKDKNPLIAKALNQLNSFMLKWKKKCGEGKYYVQKEEPTEIYPLLRKFILEADEWLAENNHQKGHEELLELYFQATAFLRIAELYDERYVTFVEIEKDVKIKLFCLDPSDLLKQAIKRGKSAVFFSATLTPIHYFREILGGNEEDNVLKLSSPFNRDHLCLLVVDNISTRLKDREDSYTGIAEYIIETLKVKKGNYLVFFPSYQYLNEVLVQFSESYPDVNIVVQLPTMSEEEREVFLEEFQSHPSETKVGFAVLGGIFSEGIDLVGDRLIGIIIVGVGLPQVGLENNEIRNYFQKKNNWGYEYAYMYPGMNKVLQAAGRVIRSEEDKGVAILIDDRFSTPAYERIFPGEWRGYFRVTKPEEVKFLFHRFWR